jgi:hypothetical protein
MLAAEFNLRIHGFQVINIQYLMMFGCQMGVTPESRVSENTDPF